MLAHSRYSTNTCWLKACHGLMERTLNYKSNGLLGFMPDHVLKRNLHNLAGAIFLCWWGHTIHLIRFLWASLLTLKIFLLNISTCLDSASTYMLRTLTSESPVTSVLQFWTVHLLICLTPPIWHPETPQNKSEKKKRKKKERKKFSLFHSFSTGLLLFL